MTPRGPTAGKLESKASAAQPPRELESTDFQRMESECTIFWQPPLWWDQQPTWMSLPPRWLNNVELRDDSALLQVGEAVASAPGATLSLQDQPVLDGAEQARLRGVLERLRTQQHALALNHHLVHKLRAIMANHA